MPHQPPSQRFRNLPQQNERLLLMIGLDNACVLNLVTFRVRVNYFLGSPGNYYSQRYLLYSRYPAESTLSTVRCIVDDAGPIKSESADVFIAKNAPAQCLCGV